MLRFIKNITKVAFTSSEKLAEEFINSYIADYIKAQKEFPSAEPHELLAMICLATPTSQGISPLDPKLQEAAFSSTFLFACLPPPINARALGIYRTGNENPTLYKSLKNLPSEYVELMKPVHDEWEKDKLLKLYGRYNPTLLQKEFSTVISFSLEGLLAHYSRWENQKVNNMNNSEKVFQTSTSEHPYDGNLIDTLVMKTPLDLVRCEDVSNYLTKSLGIETFGSNFTPIINSKTKLPANVTKVFSTADDNQETIELRFYVGNAETVSECQFLAKIQIYPIRPLPRGIPQIGLECTIDKDLVTFNAKELSSQKLLKVRCI